MGDSTTTDSTTTDSTTTDSTTTDSLSYLNSIRTNAGMSVFKSNSLLEQSAYNHARYLSYNNEYGHYESSSNTFYTGYYPTDRANYMGYKSGIGENISYESDFTGSIDTLMTAIYHRFGFLTFTKDEIGVGMESLSLDANVYNMG